MYDDNYDADVAYGIAIRRAVIVGNQRWLAEDPSRRTIIAELSKRSANGKNTFYTSLWKSYSDWGKLSPKQIDALLRSFDRDDQRRAEWARNNAKVNAGSQWVGEVGKRQMFELTCVASKYLVDAGYTFSLLKDADGNIFVYSGKELCEKDQKVAVKATVKRHQERDGVKQTAISRPTVQ